MKSWFPSALALLLTACAVVPITPEDREAAHQRELAKEARANFIAMKEQEHPGRAPVLHDDPVPPPPQPGPFAAARPSATPVPRSHAQYQAQAQPRPTPPAKTVSWLPSFLYAPTPRPRATRPADDTVYYWQVPSNREENPQHYSAAEARYARTLAKRPEDLTPEERLWAREHY